MLDLTGILFSSVMMLVVIIRAVKLDSTEAWFPALKRKVEQTPDQRTWQRQK